MPTIGTVCSGYGGIEMGLGLIIPGLDVRWVADYEPPTVKTPKPHQGAAKILAYRFPGVPNLGDITGVSWADTAPVRIVAGGTPCQDVSAAGPRVGMRAGTRSGIWSAMVAAIEHHRPDLVVWENVKGALYASADSNMEPCPICMGDTASHGLRALGRVLGDLAELGYDAVWVVLPASAVGAPHRRERVFVCAWPGGASADAGSETGHIRTGLRTSQPRRIGGRRPDHDDLQADAANTSGPRLEVGRASRYGTEQPEPVVDRRALGNAARYGRDERRTESARIGRGFDLAITGDSVGTTDWGTYAPAVRRWAAVLGRPAPAPMVAGSSKLSPVFVEWMMGLPAGHVTGVPGLTVNDQLHALGNGVVPQQLAAAVSMLLDYAPAWLRENLGRNSG